MFSSWSPFLVASAGERRPLGNRHPRLRAWLYSLSLAVYSTPWTF